MEKETLKLATKESQLQLLQQVLAASDADAEEEDIKEESVEGSREAKVSQFLVSLGTYQKNLMLLCKCVRFPAHF